jgi:hypothetical protein
VTNDLVERVTTEHSDEEEEIDCNEFDYLEQQNEKHKGWIEARLICDEHFRISKKYEATPRKNRNQMDLLPEENEWSLQRPENAEEVKRDKR